MSEFINNREYRQKILKGLIRELHEGKSVEQVKPRFEELIKGISTTEITEMEQALMEEGMPVGEIQRLCDVHAAVFKGSIEEIHASGKAEEIPGHPIHTFKLENRAIEKLINERIRPNLESYGESGDASLLREDFKLLGEIGKHYARKENLIFPYLEKYGITAPPKVMWGVDDEIRGAISETRRLLDNGGEKADVADKATEAINKIKEMIYKEENILFPMAADTLSEDEWARIARDSREIGFCLVEPVSKWKPANENVLQKAEVKAYESPDHINFDAGMMSPEEANAMLNTLPFDITFVDKDGAVKYFNQGKERIFARPKSVIGRKVQNCHPPASVHIVEKIIDDFKSGRKDHEDFWIHMKGKYVFIRYFAVRDEACRFLGTMEVTQDIQPIQDITGEKRLVSD